MKKTRFIWTGILVTALLAPALAHAGTYYIRKREPDAAQTAPAPTVTAPKRNYTTKPKAAPAPAAIRPPAIAIPALPKRECTEADMKFLTGFEQLMKRINDKDKQSNNQPSSNGMKALEDIKKFYSNPENTINLTTAQMRCAAVLYAAQSPGGKKSK